MNSFCGQIADEMQSLENQGAEILDATIENVRAGAWEVGSYAADRFKCEFNTSNLARLSNLASREQFPKYWATVDSMGGWQEAEEGFAQNMEILESLIS